MPKFCNGTSLANEHAHKDIGALFNFFTWHFKALEDACAK